MQDLHEDLNLIPEAELSPFKVLQLQGCDQFKCQ